MSNTQEPLLPIPTDLERFVQKTAEQAASQIIANVINDLQAMTDSNLMLSGDSGLLNVWEEICVQVQDDYSIYWDSHYQPLMYTQIEQALEQKPMVLLQLMAYELVFEEVDEDGGIGVDMQALVAELEDRLCSEAADFNNDRIEAYINGEFDADEEEDEEDDDEEEFDDNETDEANER